MAKKKEPEKQDKKNDIIVRAKKCLEDAIERESDNRKRAEDAIKFRAGQQWPDKIKLDRENPHQEGGPRPCPVLDKTNQYVRQVVNEERQNRAAIKIRPVDDKADPEVAEVYTGIIRHIEYSSNALTAYTTAGEQAIDGGFGYWRILTEYCDDMSFEQDIRIKRIPNRFSVVLGYHTEPDGSDAQEAVIWEDLTKEEFREKYPHANVKSFDTDESGWVTDDMIRVAEYFCIKSDQITIHLLENGNVLTEDEVNEMKKGGFEVPPIIQSRKSLKKTVKWYKLNSEEVLEQRDLIGKYIPVIKVIGNELFMPDGKCRLSGMVETMMDPQRLHNYASAGFIETVALAPRAPWLAEEQQVEGYETDYAVANRQNIAVLKYKAINSDTGHLIPPPQRQPPPGISPGWQQMLLNTEHGIEASVGMYGPTVGAKSQEKSGVALQEQKTQGMVGNFHFPDNLARSIQHTGRILVDWIPEYYGSSRVARIIGEDESESMAYLDPEQEQPVMDRVDKFGQPDGKSYNLNVGRYDVTVSTGPSYTAKRQEGAELLTQVLQGNKELFPLVGDVYFDILDMPYSDKIRDRLKAMLPPQLQGLEEDKEKPIDPRVTALMAQVEQAAAQLEERAALVQEAEQKVQAAMQDVESNKTALESEKKNIESLRKILHADYARIKAEIELEGRRMLDEVGKAASEGEPKEPQPQQPQQPQQPAIVVDNSAVIAQPLAQVGQAIQEVGQSIADMVSNMQQNNMAIAQLAAAQSKPREVTLSDGRKISVRSLQ